MMDRPALREFCQKRPEVRIIDELAVQEGISYEKAMEIYFGSKNADMIRRGTYDTQYLDYKVLTQMLCEMQGENLQAETYNGNGRYRPFPFFYNYVFRTERLRSTEDVPQGKAAGCGNMEVWKYNVFLFCTNN